MRYSVVTKRVVALLVGCLACHPVVAAGSARPQIVDARLGFDDLYKTGYWTPVAISLHGGDEPVKGVVAVTALDTDGVATTLFSEPLELEPDRPAQIELPVRIGQATSDLGVAFQIEGGESVTRTFHPGEESGQGRIRGGLPATSELNVVVGARGDDHLPLVEALENGRPAQESVRSHVVFLAAAASLPEEAYLYDGVDNLLLFGSARETFGELDSARAVALRRWVEGGGRLTLFCGQHAAELIGSGGPLESLVPGRFAELETLRRVTMLENFSNAQQEIVTPGQRLDLRVPRLVDVRGRVLAFGGQRATDLPLIVRRRLGLGQLTFVAFDFDLPPFSDWSDQTKFLRELLEVSDYSHPNLEDLQSQRLSRIGFNDMSGQVRAALEDNLTGVTMVPFALVAVLIIVYIVLIGPADYFFVKKFCRRMETTWITFPLVVLAFGGLAYWLATTLKGDQLRVNQIELVDVALDTKVVRGTLWSHLFSPRAQRYDLSLAARFAGQEVATPRSVQVSWMGLPGESLGGMQFGSASGRAFLSDYRYGSQLDRLEGVPVHQWATKSFEARWTTQVDIRLAAELSMDENGLLLGEVTNDLGVDLDDCYLFHRDWCYPLRQLKQGRTVTVADTLRPRRAASLLKGMATGADFAAARGADLKRPYSRYTSDVGQVMTALMFFRKVGGHVFTGLLNRYFADCDLSDVLDDPQRAILLAVCPTPQSELLRAGQSMRVADEQAAWTYYRFVIPVSDAPEAD